MNDLVITGGSGGLGMAVIHAFSDPEWKITAPTHAELDVTNLTALREYFQSRHVDLLIVAAGITRDAPLRRLVESEWDEVWTTNFQGAANMAAAILPGMIQQGRGHIVFISSFSALHPPLGQTAYATAKAALLGLTAVLAQLHGPHGIRINAVLPGFLETRMTEPVSVRRRAEILGAHTLGRFNTPTAVAKFIRHLHADLPHTSGQIFQLDSRIP